MIWGKLIGKISEVVHPADKNEWLSKLVENIKKYQELGENLPFRITQMKDKGFEVKVGGLFAFISFQHMPWKYDDNRYWVNIYQYLLGKTLYCKIHELKQSPLQIIIDGEVPQFKSPDFQIEEKCSGIILIKGKNGIFVEFGYHFHWRSGSVMTFISRSNFGVEEFELLEAGKIIETIYWGDDTDGDMIFGNKSNDKYWVTGEFKQMLGKSVSVEIFKDTSMIPDLLVEGKYSGCMPINKTIYPNHRSRTHKAIKKLKNGDIIHCSVIKINKVKRSITLKWELSDEIERVLSIDKKEILTSAKKKTPMVVNEMQPVKTTIMENAITNGSVKKELSKKEKQVPNYGKIKKTLSQKLSRFETKHSKSFLFPGKQVKVQVFKIADKPGIVRNNYVVENSCHGELLIISDHCEISKETKAMIEKSFNNKEILNCKVLSIKNNFVYVVWKITDTELSAFI